MDLRGGSRRIGATFALVAATLAVALWLRRELSIPDPEMLFLVAVMVAASRWGRREGLIAAALGVAAYDYFFVEPLHTFTVGDRRYVLTFAMMFGVGLVLATLSGQLELQRRRAALRERRTTSLYGLARALGNAHDRHESLDALAHHAALALGARATVIEGDLPARAGPDDARELRTRTLVVHADPTTDQGAMLRLEGLPADLDGEVHDFLAVMVQHCRDTIERLRLADAARAAALRADAEEAKSSVLASVSHDLRTPLGAITGAATALRDEPILPPEVRRELLDAICSEASRLERLVSNLLDMSRLEAGAVSPAREAIPVDEVVGSALTRLEHKLGKRPVEFEIPADLPWVLADPVLLEVVVVNLLDNANAYTPEGLPITVHASIEPDAPDWLRLDVADRGTGLLPGTEERIFARFDRGGRREPEGAGLGLAICRGIVEAHGGTIQAQNREQGGALFRVRLPVAPASTDATGGERR